MMLMSCELLPHVVIPKWRSRDEWIKHISISCCLSDRWWCAYIFTCHSLDSDLDMLAPEPWAFLTYRHPAVHACLIWLIKKIPVRWLHISLFMFIHVLLLVRSWESSCTIWTGILPPTLLPGFAVAYVGQYLGARKWTRYNKRIGSGGIYLYGPLKSDKEL